MEETKFDIINTIKVKEKNDNNNSCNSYNDSNLITSNKNFENDNDSKIYEEQEELNIINLKKIGENNDLLKPSKLLYNGNSPEKEENVFKSISLIEDNNSSKNKKEIDMKGGEKNKNNLDPAHDRGKEIIGGDGVGGVKNVENIENKEINGANNDKEYYEFYNSYKNNPEIEIQSFQLVIIQKETVMENNLYTSDNKIFIPENKNNAKKTTIIIHNKNDINKPKNEEKEIKNTETVNIKEKPNEKYVGDNKENIKQVNNLTLSKDKVHEIERNEIKKIDTKEEEEKNINNENNIKEVKNENGEEIKEEKIEGK